MKKIIIAIFVLSVGLNAFPAKKATAACPTKSSFKGFIRTGSISSGLSAFPECRIIYKGMNIDQILDREWSTAQVRWTDINGNKRVDFVSIESVR